MLVDWTKSDAVVMLVR